MLLLDWVQIIVFFVLLIGITPPLGVYMAAIYQGKPHLYPVLGWMENGIYRLCGVHKQIEMDWKTYAKAMAGFNFLCLVFLFFLQLFQGWLPLNPQDFPGIGWPLALNTAISFVTNTNWQAYAGEDTMSYLTQMAGFNVQNFLSAATGSAVLAAFIRGIVLKTGNTIGNFWIDLTRTVVYLFLPICLIFAIILVSQGSIQNFHSYIEATTIEGEKQLIPMGPVASQVAIKQIGTNGGGFFNANSAHPFENPTPFSNFLENFAILLIPAAATYMYGVMINSRRQGWLIFIVMLVLLIAGLLISQYAEHLFNPVLGINPVLEGKETRFGLAGSIDWAVMTTGTSNGSVNSMHSSLSPIAGGIAMFNMMIGEIIFGGVGVGLASMLMYTLLTVFLAGLMVGRTPEFQGKKIEKTEMKWVMLSVLSPCALILIGAGAATLLPFALESLGNSGPHGLSEVLYAYSSSAANNGSAFAGLQANTLFYNMTLGIIMLLTRLAILIPSLAIAGSLAHKRVLAPSLGTFSTGTSLFALLLISVILIVAALTFFPALSLGPLVEQILMLRGRSF